MLHAGASAQKYLIHTLPIKTGGTIEQLAFLLHIIEYLEDGLSRLNMICVGSDPNIMSEVELEISRSRYSASLPKVLKSKYLNSLQPLESNARTSSPHTLIPIT